MQVHSKDVPLFALGVVCATPAALETLRLCNTDFGDLVSRHVTGDWGAISEEDAALNEIALAQGGRLLSVYLLPDQTVIWVITEADRSATTLLLPEDY
jgi:hypothetical protein